MKKLALLAALVLAWSPAYAQSAKTKSGIQAEISNQLPDNHTGAISPSVLRGVLNDISASYQQAPSVNQQTGTSYAVTASDYGALVTFNNASSVTVTLPSGSALTPFSFFASNLGSGTVTIAPASGTIDGGSSISLGNGQLTYIVSDGFNWKTSGIGQSGNVTGPASAVSGNLSSYNGATGKVIQDSGILASSVVTTSNAPSAWATICGNTIGFIWARLTGGWACSRSFDAPVTWWGAACDGSTNDATAFSTALASGVSSISISGTCNVNATIAVPNNVTLHGENWATSCIRSTVATGDIIQLTNGDQLRDICVTSSVTRTAGASVHIGGGTVATNAAYISVKNVQVLNFYNAFWLNAAQSVRIDDILALGQSWSNRCVLGSFSDTTQILNTDDVVHGMVCTNAADGVEILNAGDIEFERLQVFNSPNGFVVDPTGAVANKNVVQFVTCASCLLDTGTNAGLIVNPTLGGAVWTVKFTNSWIASYTNYGVLIQTDSGHSSAVNETDVDNSIIANNSCGVVVQNAAAAINTNIVGDTIAGNSSSIGGCGGAGLWIGTGTAALHVVGTRLGNSSQFSGNTLGINFQTVAGTGCSNCSFVGNDMTGNTTLINLTAGVVLTGAYNDNIGWHTGSATLSACGSGAISGNDYAGNVANAGNNCTILFSNAYQTAPGCTVQDGATRTGMGVSVANNGISIGGLTVGDSLSYVCRPSVGN